MRTPTLTLLLAAALSGQIVERGFHLTARPWQALNTPRGRYLEVIEGVVRFSIKHQNEQGAIVAFAERTKQLTPERQQELANLLQPLTQARGAVGVQRLLGLASSFLGRQ